MGETYASSPQAGQRLPRPTLSFMVGVPLAWAVLLFHPKGDAGSIYRDVHDQVTATLAVHIGMLLFIPLMAGVVYLLLRGLEGNAARVGRWALVPFVVFYSAWETLQGIGNGVLVNEVNGLAAAERGFGAKLVQDFAESPLVRDMGVFAVPGSLAFIVALIAAGIALHRYAGAPVSVAVLLGFAGFLITSHPPPFGPIGLGIFIVALLLFVRSQSEVRAAAGVGQPSTA